MTQVKRQPQNSSASHLLTNEENATLVRILGPRCPSLATAVVQIYMSDSSSGKQVGISLVTVVEFFCGAVEIQMHQIN